MKKFPLAFVAATALLATSVAQAQTAAPSPLPALVVANELACSASDAVQVCVTTPASGGGGMVVLINRRNGRALADCTVAQPRGVRLACVSSRDVRRAECQARRGVWNEERGTCRLPHRASPPTPASPQLQATCTPTALAQLRSEIVRLEGEPQRSSRDRFAQATELYGVAVLCVQTELATQAAGLVADFSVRTRQDLDEALSHDRLADVEANQARLEAELAARPSTPPPSGPPARRRLSRGSQAAVAVAGIVIAIAAVTVLSWGFSPNGGDWGGGDADTGVLHH